MMELSETLPIPVEEEKTLQADESVIEVKEPLPEAEENAPLSERQMPMVETTVLQNLPQPEAKISTIDNSVLEKRTVEQLVAARKENIEKGGMPEHAEI